MTIDSCKYKVESCTRTSVADRDWRAQATAQRCAYAETWPTGAPPSVEIFQRRAAIVDMPPRAILWSAITATDDIVAAARLAPHPAGMKRAFLGLYVLSKARRQGISKSLLRAMVNASKDNGVEILNVETTSCLPVGKDLVLRCGGRLVDSLGELEIHAAEFALRHADFTDRKSDGVVAGLEGITFKLENGRYQEADIPSITRLKRMISVMYGSGSAPVTSERAIADSRLQENSLERLGIERWTAYAVAPSGEIVGYSEALWDPEEPAILRNKSTAVATSHQGRGLTVWLYAQFVKILRLKVPIRFLRATMMLPQMGYLVNQGWAIHHTSSRWEVPLARLSHNGRF